MIDNPKTTDEQAEVLFESFEKLVDEDQMGRRFKVLGITDAAVEVAPGFWQASDTDQH